MTSLVSMILSGGLYAADSQDRDPSNDFWYGPVGTGTAAGVAITPERALQASAVYACVRYISETLAALPFGIFRRKMDGSGDREEMKGHPVSRLFNRKANGTHTAFQYRALKGAHLTMRGNHYAEILPGRLGAVSELRPLHPDLVLPERIENGRIRYEVHELDGRIRRLTQDEVWHVRGLVISADAICGLDPITHAARETVGARLAAQDYGARFFANDATPGGVLEHPNHFADKEARANFKKSWQAAQGGMNRGKTAVLEDGLKYNALTITNEQAQFLESLRYGDVDIARIFRVQPHKIGILDRATFSNIEQQAIESVTDTLLPWLINIEQSITEELIVGDDELFAEFNVMGLLRGDTESRFRAYAIGRNWGWLSANDVRRLENQNSIGADGDEYLRPANMTPTDAPEQMSNGPQRSAGAFIHPRPNGRDHQAGESDA